METNVIQYLQSAARRYSEKVALVDETASITYGELDRMARKVALLIRDRCGNATNQPVAVYMNKSIHCIVSFLGIVYSGNFYCPLDRKSPPERITRIIDVLNPISVIHDGYSSDSIEFPCEKIDYHAAEMFESDDFVDNYKAILDIDPLYVMFTSGSTGQPKGVVINHRSVIDYAEWLQNKFQFTDKTIFGNQAPFYFDNSILDIYSTIKNGAQLVVIPENLFVFPNSLIEYINRQKINTLFWVPSALIGVANSGILEKTYIPQLEKVLFCGEVMPNKQLNIWRKRYPHILYANLYGPTEITDVCAYYIIDREFADDDPLPIGRACENTEVLVLNDKDQLVQGDEIGELCVRGICLSLGYYRNAEKTDASFVQNPLNTKYHDLIYRTGDLVKYNEFGEIIYIGRKDFQIKHQGHRIELGEIEAAAYGLTQMKQCCSIYNDVSKKIILYCVVDSLLSEKEIYSFLKKKIPRYMLPGEIYLEKELPMNANGKIDRLSLKNR